MPSNVRKPSAQRGRSKAKGKDKGKRRAKTSTKSVRSPSPDFYPLYQYLRDQTSENPSNWGSWWLVGGKRVATHPHHDADGLLTFVIVRGGFKLWAYLMLAEVEGDPLLTVDQQVYMALERFGEYGKEFMDLVQKDKKWLRLVYLTPGTIL